MGGRRVRVASLCALLALGGLTAFLVSRPVDPGATRVSSPLLGTRPPPITAATLQHATVSLASLHGRVVVLSFVASWCGACGTEAPALVTYAWHEHVTHTPATILGVVYSDDDAAVAAFARDHGLTFPVLVDPGGVIANDFAVASPPATVVLDPAGRVAAVLLGAVSAHQLVSVTTDALREAA
ncbi:MAG TPA: TlpA disulfide reductase family protein [Acidimicrobiales bacterium]|jgi:peroxiredoxin|nr:TlpA disulfide reductase family protein [Acidimicrobiales bacterium]